MVNLLPDEMKKEEEGEGFDQGIEERNSTEDKKDIPMTKPVQEISSSKKKSPAFWKKFRDFIFKKKSQEKKETKPVETTPLAQQETEVNKEREEEKKSQVSLAKKKEKHQKKEKTMKYKDFFHKRRRLFPFFRLSLLKVYSLLFTLLKHIVRTNNS